MNELALFSSMALSLPNGTPMASRAGILSIEETLRATFDSDGSGNWEDDFPCDHYFSLGIYCREIHIPAGHVVVGKIHKFEHINVISKGRVTCMTEFGVEVYEAPCTFISKAGIKRVVYAHEDTVWAGFFPSTTGSPADVEKDIICKSFEELDAHLAIESKVEENLLCGAQ